MVETWKPIPEWQGYYEVSGQGNIRSLDRRILRTTGVWQKVRGREMKKNSNHLGYLFIQGARDNTLKRIWVHRAVLEAFVSERPPGAVCMHLNNDMRDNRLENLRWGTQLENIQQRDAEGRNANTRKTHCPRGHVLVDPNLNKYVLSKGRRACQACYRATQDYPLKHHGELVVREVSDNNYARIMGVTRYREM